LLQESFGIEGMREDAEAAQRMTLELAAKTFADGAEDGGDLVAEDGQNADNDNSNQNKDQSVLDEALAFLTGEEIAKHVCHLPFVRMDKYQVND
jgi:hypothetical protein